MNDNTEISKKKVLQDGEIDLIELVRAIWSKKWILVKFISVFCFLGLIIAFTSPEEYKTSSILIPEGVSEEGKLSSSLGGLASLAGVDLGNSNSSNGINPALYQSISQSTPFLMALMSQEYYFDELDDTISVRDYYENHYKLSLIGKLISVPSQVLSSIKQLIVGESDAKPIGSSTGNELVILSKFELSVIKNLYSRVFVEMDWELNIVNIQIEMQDPLVAAEMAIFTQEYITNYVTEYATTKSLHQLKSLEKQYENVKLEFQKAQMKLAYFQDGNKNVSTAKAKTEEKKLQSEYDLSFNVYNQLAQQREALRLKVEENTPVFTMLEPVMVPVEKSSPRRGIILIISNLLGLLLGVIWLFMKELTF